MAALAAVLFHGGETMNKFFRSISLFLSAAMLFCTVGCAKKSGTDGNAAAGAAGETGSAEEEQTNILSDTVEADELVLFADDTVVYLDETEKITFTAHCREELTDAVELRSSDGGAAGCIGAKRGRRVFRGPDSPRR